MSRRRRRLAPNKHLVRDRFVFALCVLCRTQISPIFFYAYTELELEPNKNMDVLFVKKQCDSFVRAL